MKPQQNLGCVKPTNPSLVHNTKTQTDVEIEHHLFLASALSRGKGQMKHQLDATLCRFYFCRVTLHVSGASAHHQEYLKLVQRPLVHVLSLQVSHHISLLGPERP